MLALQYLKKKKKSAQLIENTLDSNYFTLDGNKMTGLVDWQVSFPYLFRTRQLQQYVFVFLNLFLFCPLMKQEHNYILARNSNTKKRPSKPIQVTYLLEYVVYYLIIVLGTQLSESIMDEQTIKQTSIHLDFLLFLFSHNMHKPKKARAFLSMRSYNHLMLLKKNCSHTSTKHVANSDFIYRLP